MTQLPIRYLKLGLVYIAGDDWGGGGLSAGRGIRELLRESRVGWDSGPQGWRIVPSFSMQVR